MSIIDESAISYRIDKGTFPDPLLPTIGISDGECCVSFPSGIDVIYLLLELRRTGGKSSEFIFPFYYWYMVMIINNFLSKGFKINYTQY